jgi:hypothetical protein
MLKTKCVLRLLTADNQLLGWGQVDAEARGDGYLSTRAPIPIHVDVAGTCAALSIHWCDLNVEVRVPPPIVEVTAGMTVLLQPGRLLKAGEMPTDLPPVTIRQPTVVSIDVGMMGVAPNLTMVGGQ